MHKRCLCLRVVSVPSCVRPSVCMSRSCILSKRINISSIFFTSGCHTILVFPYQTSGQYPTETPITGASNAGGVWKNRCFRPVSRFIACCQRCDRQASGVINTVPADRGKLVTLIAGSSKRRNLLMAEDGDEVFMTRSFNITPTTTEQHLIVHSGKSEATVSNNWRVCSRYCTIEANYWQTQSIVRPLCISRATCMFCALFFVSFYLW